MDKRLFRNIISLFGIQGMNYFIPLITLPYLVKTLGPESYGILVFSLAFTQYFCLLTDYGFNLSASRRIAMCASDKSQVSSIYWHVMSCKLIIAIACLLILFLTAYYIPYLRLYRDVIFCSYGMVLGNILFPVWLFQGKEQMGLSSLANIVSRALSIPLIFTIVHDENDAILAALITSVTAVCGGVASIILLMKKNWICFEKISLKKIRLEFRDGWHVFLSTAAISLYTTSITVVLGFISGPIAVGYYVAADKLRQAAQGLLVPLAQAIYPRVNSMMAQDRELTFNFLRNFLCYFSLLGLIISIIIICLGAGSISLLYGTSYHSSVAVLNIMAICPLLVAVSNVLGTQTMLTAGYSRQFSRILIVSGLICLTTLVPLSYRYAEIGAAFSVLLTEFSVTLAMFIFVKKHTPLFTWVNK